MNRAIQKSAAFQEDLTRQFGWYLEVAGEELAWRFVASVNFSLDLLAQQPDLGRPRHFSHPALQDLRSFGARQPFERVLIFYRATDDFIQAWRLMHGMRDLGNRLIEGQA